MASYDLILRGGRVIDPSQSIDGVMDVAFAGGKAAGVGTNLKAGPATEVRDVSGFIVTPGLIDLHTHVYWGGTSLGIDAEDFCRTSGVTTSIDTGSAGPGNFAGFRRHVIERSETRILAYLHVSFAGIFAFSKSHMIGKSKSIELMAPRQAVEVAEKNRDVVVGIKVRVGLHASGDQGSAPLGIALQVADEVGMPLMCHIDHPPPSYEEVIGMLRPGDVLTHAFRPFPNAPVNAQGKVKAAVLEARQRGVLFDIGHGSGSFSFKTARAMLANGFMPDTISSDVHALCIDGPAFDLATTMSKFLELGVPLPEVIRQSTTNAAMALRRPELGSLKPGSAGDATILSVNEGAFDYVDVMGEHLAAAAVSPPKPPSWLANGGIRPAKARFRLWSPDRRLYAVSRLESCLEHSALPHSNTSRGSVLQVKASFTWIWLDGTNAVPAWRAQLRTGKMQEDRYRPVPGVPGSRMNANGTISLRPTEARVASSGTDGWMQAIGGLIVGVHDCAPPPPFGEPIASDRKSDIGLTYACPECGQVFAPVRASGVGSESPADNVIPFPVQAPVR